MVQKKMGRPTNEPKDKTKNVRLSEADMEKLNFCIQATGKTGNEIIRLGIEKVYKELKK